MKSRTFVLIIGLAFLAVWTPALEANPIPPAILHEIGEAGFWFELIDLGYDLEEVQIRIDGELLEWDLCYTEDHGAYILVYPLEEPQINPEGGIIQVFYYEFDEIAYGFAGHFPQVPFNGSLVRVGDPWEEEIWTVSCGGSTPGSDNPVLPPPADALPSFVLNEIYLPPGSVGQRFVEIYNPTAESQDLTGWSIYINDCHLFPDGTVLSPGEFRTFTVATHPLGNLSRTRDQIGLVGPDSVYYFTVKWSTALDSGYSWCLFPDGDVTEWGERPYDLTAFYEARPVTQGGPNGGEAPPTPFHLLSPEYGDTCWTSETVLVWQTALDPDPNDTVRYAVWLDTLPNLTTCWEVSSGLLDTVFSLESLADDHAYYWTVHASDLNTPGTWASDTLMFRTYFGETPLPFSLLEPEDASQLPFGEITFCWQDARDPDPGDAISYTLFFAAGGLSFSWVTGSDTCWIVDVGALGLPDTVTAEWWVTAHSSYPDTTVESLERFTFEPPSGVGGQREPLPETFTLGQNYPNPFNASTVLTFAVSEPSPVRISVFDIIGREVANLADERFAPGYYRLSWDCRTCATGVYFIVMQTPSFHAVQKALMIR